MKFYKMGFLTVLILSCAPIRVTHDFDKTTDFSQFKTYNYFSDMKTGLSELDTKRFLDALDLEMDKKGFTLSETPDFFIDIQSNEFQEAPRNTVGVGLGGGGRNVGGGISIGIPVGQANVNRQIRIDFVDEYGKGLFWQAVCESSFIPNALPEKREAQFMAIVEKSLSKYPPKS